MDPVNNLSLKDSVRPGTKEGLLSRGDSGYISPMTPASTGSTPSDSAPIRRSLSTANTHIRPPSASDVKPPSNESSPEIDQPNLDRFTPSPISFACPSDDLVKVPSGKVSVAKMGEMSQDEESLACVNDLPQGQVCL